MAPKNPNHKKGITEKVKISVQYINGMRQKRSVNIENLLEKNSIFQGIYGDKKQMMVARTHKN